MYSIKPFGKYSDYDEVKSRAEHECFECGAKLPKGSIYLRCLEAETGYDRKLCVNHLDEEAEEAWQRKRGVVVEKATKGFRITLETDASGPSGERWAFVSFEETPEKKKEVHREHGHTPDWIYAITPAEGYAVLKSLQWLAKAEAEGIVQDDWPVLIINDNSAVISKLQTSVPRGKFRRLWKEIIDKLKPYKDAGRVFISGSPSDEAHLYAQKRALLEEFKHERTEK